MIVRLDEHHYLRPLDRVRLGASFVHTACVDFDGHVATAFVKIYQPGTAELFNDALGYLITAALDLPRPPHAAIIEVPPHRLYGPVLQAPDHLCEGLGGNSTGLVKASGQSYIDENAIPGTESAPYPGQQFHRRRAELSGDHRRCADARTRCDFQRVRQTFSAQVRG